MKVQIPLMDDISINIIVSTLILFGSFLLGGIIKLLGRLWWSPMKIQWLMRSQGIQGPSYNFIQGNSKEMYSRRMKAMATPMELSHHILPRVLPHTHSWLNNYGIQKPILISTFTISHYCSNFHFLKPYYVLCFWI